MSIPKQSSTFFSIRILTLSLACVFLMPDLMMGQGPQLPDTTRVCNADSALLDAGEGFQFYQWNTSDTTQTIWVFENGVYDVTCITDTNTVFFDTTRVFFQNAYIDMVDTVLTCYTYPVTLCVEPDTLMYQWTSDDPDLFIEFDTAACVDVIPRLDTTTVYANITDSLGIITCVDSVQIWLYPRMRFDEVNQINTGCPGTCKGQLQVIVSGGLPPYEYEWPTATPVQRDSIVFGLCEQEYQFTVEDEYMCVRDTMIPVEVFDMPEVEIVRDPEDEIYIQNPVVNFSFVNNSADSIQVIDWNWDFGDSTYTKEEAPVKVFDQVRDFDVWLKYTTADECIDSVSMTVTIGEAELTVYNMISPNSDGNNDVFTIENLEYYISNKLKVFNRYGKRVFSADNYQNDWGGDNLREGVYFYTLEAVGYFRTENLQGSLTILR